MTVLCVIPARGGSKGIPRKNLRKVGGQSLVARAIGSAAAASLVETVVVSTDDDEISGEATRRGAEVIRRPEALSDDTASSEVALLHAIEEHRARNGEQAEVLVFLQCTSPVIDPADIDRAVAMVTDGTYDSVFSAVRSHAFLWRQDDGVAVGINHDSRLRQRRQDRPEEFRETGAIYVMRVAGFVESGHRFFGRVGVCEVPPAHGLDIDAEDDLAAAQFAAQRQGAGGLSSLDSAKVAALVMDFDGVHTDNVAHVDQTGTESVAVNRSDGMGLAALRLSGLEMLILSTERNPVVAARAKKLGIECVQGSDDKLTALRGWADERDITPEAIVYIGNDTNDLECLEFVGWPVAVADSHPSVLSCGAMVTQRSGGSGALRELADHLLAEPGALSRDLTS